MNVEYEIERLNIQRERGLISEEEYRLAEESLLNEGQSPSEKLSGAGTGASSAEKRWSMFIHMSQWLGIVVVPGIGLVVPIILWRMKKNKSRFIDAQGRTVVNWIISQFIYTVVFFLSLVLIEPPMLEAFSVFGVVFIIVSLGFPVVGAFYADKGKIWNFPLTINVFRID